MCRPHCKQQIPHIWINCFTNFLTCFTISLLLHTNTVVVCSSKENREPFSQIWDLNSWAKSTVTYCSYTNLSEWVPIIKSLSSETFNLQSQLNQLTVIRLIRGILQLWKKTSMASLGESEELRCCAAMTSTAGAESMLVMHWLSISSCSPSRDHLLNLWDLPHL